MDRVRERVIAMFLEGIGERIRSQREKRGLKQQDIANALHISPQAVSKWERGENAPDVALLGPLARVLGMSVDWLLAVNESGKDEFEATVLATSVLGAYEKSIGMAPRDFATWANGIFYPLTEITLRHDGVPVKYLGDQYLCFFSGPGHADRALKTALRAKSVLAAALKVGLATGRIYLGSVGHPDYARPDIMGEVVNIAFLVMQWAESNTRSGIGAAGMTIDASTVSVRTSALCEVSFRDLDHPVEVVEVLEEEDDGKE